MTPSFKQAVQRNFHKSAQTYNHHGAIQKYAAQKLVECIQGSLACPMPSIKVADIGCGTGFVTESISSLFPNASYTLIDLAPSMVEVCKARFPYHSVFLMDGEKDKIPGGPYDLITSGLTVQWFENLHQGLLHLLSQTRYLAVSLLLEGTFDEWKLLCQENSINDKILPFPSLGIIKGFLGNEFQSTWLTEKIVYPYESPLAFLQSLKGIGATASKESQRAKPLQRDLLKAPHPFPATYHLGYGVLKAK